MSAYWGKWQFFLDRKAFMFVVRCVNVKCCVRTVSVWSRTLLWKKRCWVMWITFIKTEKDMLRDVDISHYYQSHPQNSLTFMVGSWKIIRWANIFRKHKSSKNVNHQMGINVYYFGSYILPSGGILDEFPSHIQKALWSQHHIHLLIERWIFHHSIKVGSAIWLRNLAVEARCAKTVGVWMPIPP